MVLDAALLHTQHYKVGKVDQSSENDWRLSLLLGMVAAEKVAFESPSTTVTFISIYLSIYCYGESVRKREGEKERHHDEGYWDRQRESLLEQ